MARLAMAYKNNNIFCGPIFFACHCYGMCAYYIKKV